MSSPDACPTFFQRVYQVVFEPFLNPTSSAGYSQLPSNDLLNTEEDLSAESTMDTDADSPKLTQSHELFAHSQQQNGKTNSASTPASPRNHDPELEGLSLYEKKSILVNRELDSQGMGRYQWMIFFLCGFGYFLDLLWAQAFGLVVASMQQEFGFSDIDLGNLSTSFSAGLTAGAAMWGILVDIIGRYWAFNFTVLTSSIFGICLGAPDNYNAVLVLTAFVGIGIGGNIPIDTTICLELLPQNRRWLLPTLSIFQPLGVIVCSALAYAFIPNYSCATDLKACSQVAKGVACCTKADNYGWRYLMFVQGGITIFVFFARFVVFSFQESPKYLLYRGRDEEVLKVLQYIARYNKTVCTMTMETFANLTDDSTSSASSSTLDAEGGAHQKPIVLGSGIEQQNLPLAQKFRLELQRYKFFFSSAAMIRLVLLVWIIYGFDYWGFSIAGGFLPIIIRRKGTKLGLSLLQTYRSYIYIYIFGIPGVLAGTLIYGHRRIAMIVSSALFGAMLFTFTAVNSQASYIGINGLVYFFQSQFNAVLYGWTPEAFPAPIRGTAVGVASFWGRIFSIIAPIVAARVLAVSLNGVLYLAGASVFVCTVAICFLPGQYLGSQSL